MKKIEGAGLGLRHPYFKELILEQPKQISWLEIHPENYVGAGGYFQQALEQLNEFYPIVCHGLTLSLIGVDEFNWNYLKKLKAFLRRYNVPWITDHLCIARYKKKFFHDLLPPPFTKEAIKHSVQRVKTIQDFLEIPVGIENLSYYLSPYPAEMTEAEFLSEIVERANAYILLD